MSMQTYVITHSDELGRYMIAARDLEIGDIIFEESPVVSGPQVSSPPICPGCYRVVSTNCSKCNWPMCDKECPQKSRHEITECGRLQEINSNSTETIDWTEVSDCLMLYRCLELPKDSIKWKVLHEMESHWDKWTGSSLIERISSLLPSLRKYFQITSEYDVDEILLMQAILYINAFEVRMPEVNIQAIYELCCLLEHNCVPNTHRAISGESLLLTVRAATAIPKGTHLSTSYCDILWSTRQRQEFLQWSKFFICKCERCQDPSEFETYLSAFLCPRCPSLSPVIPNLSESTQENTFRCKNCAQEWKFTDSDLEESLRNAESELEELDANQAIEKSEKYMAWISRWSLFPTEQITKELKEQTKRVGTISNNESGSTKWILHPQHSIILDACHTLFLLYSYGETTPMGEMTNKILLGQHLLQSTANITQGISKFQGTILCEVALTRFAILLRTMDLDNEAETDCVKSYAKESVRLMQEALVHLKYEPPDQPEGAYFVSGLCQLTQFRTLLSTIISDFQE